MIESVLKDSFINLQSNMKNSLGVRFMKKILSLFLFLSIASPFFAKEKFLPVTKTEWGFEISIVNAKGEKNCDFLTLPYWYQSSQSFCNTCIIFKSGNDIFDFEKFAKEYVENESGFYGMENEKLIIPDSYQVEPNRYILGAANKVLVVFVKGNYSDCKTLVSMDSNIDPHFPCLNIYLSGYSNISSSNVETLIQKPLAEKRQNKNQPDQSKREIDVMVYNEKLVEQDKILKKYGFSSRNEYLNWLKRCRPIDRFMPKRLLSEDSFSSDDKICVSLSIEYKRNLETIFFDNNKFIYLFYDYSNEGVDCFSIVSEYQLNSFQKFFGTYLAHFYEPMILKYVGKRQYRIPKPVRNPYTSKIIEKGSLMVCNTFEIANYYEYSKMMREFHEVGLLDPDYIDPTRTNYLYLDHYENMLSYIDYNGEYLER